MTIKVGDKVPSVKLKYKAEEGVKDITTDEVFSGKKVVLFALPGAFTPTCSAGVRAEPCCVKAKGRRRHCLPLR